MIIAVKLGISRRDQAWHGTRFEAPRRSSAHRQRSCVENRGATVEDEFGDDWWHQINVEAIEDKAPSGKFPKVTKRVGKSPPQYLEEHE
jgi:hypothetical protein